MAGARVSCLDACSSCPRVSGAGSWGASLLCSCPRLPSYALYQGCHHNLEGGPASLAEFSLLALCAEGREVFLALTDAPGPLKPWQPSESPWWWEAGVHPCLIGFSQK